MICYYKVKNSRFTHNCQVENQQNTIYISLFFRSKDASKFDFRDALFSRFVS